MTPHATRKAMSDLYRECNPFEPETPTLREQVQDVASLLAITAVLVAGSLFSIAFSAL